MTLRGEVFTVTGRMYIEVCCNCGIAFAITAELHQRLLDEGRRRSFYCPNGHGQHYTESTEAKLRAELAKEKARTDAFARDAEAAWKEADEGRKELRRIKRRAAAGVCPHCNRQFVGLARHMQSKHRAELADAGVKLRPQPKKERMSEKREKRT